jgi:L,D-peptidoglycan transpeptidase YkuD (ErfK/YbiS/YcfS/YnhG family)
MATIAVFGLLVGIDARTGAAGATRSATCVALAGIPATSTEAVEVTAPSARSTRATVTLYRRTATGCFVEVAGPFGAWVGANGLSSHHVEGDLTTPIGVFGFEPVMYGVLANPGVHVPFHRLVCGDWWDEDPNSSQYNEFVRTRCGAIPAFRAASEALWQEVPAYDAFAVVAYNTDLRVPGRGSGIFLHRSLGRPTAGCVSLGWANLLRVLRFIIPADQPRIVIRVG